MNDSKRLTNNTMGFARQAFGQAGEPFAEFQPMDFPFILIQLKLKKELEKDFNSNLISFEEFLARLN